MSARFRTSGHGTLVKFRDERIDQSWIEMIADIDPFADIVERTAPVVDEPFKNSGSICLDHFQYEVGVSLGKT